MWDPQEVSKVVQGLEQPGPVRGVPTQGIEWALRSLQSKPFHDFRRAAEVTSNSPSHLQGVLAGICWDNLGAVRSSFTFPNTSWRLPSGGQERVLQPSELGSVPVQSWAGLGGSWGV